VFLIVAKYDPKVDFENGFDFENSGFDLGINSKAWALIALFLELMANDVLAALPVSTWVTTMTG
jgi:hypothetical protein